MRQFMRGEMVKRSLTDAESAVIIETISQVKLESLFHVGRRVDGWVPWDQLKNSLVFEKRDRVVYNNWVGTVEEVSYTVSAWVRHALAMSLS